MKITRWYCTALAGILVFNSTFVSTIPQGTMDDILKRFGVAQEVGTLTISVRLSFLSLLPGSRMAFFFW